MTTTDRFFTWYFEGLSGLGGWLFFFMLAVAAIAWLFYDSQTRRIPALGWMMGAALLGVLVLPSLIYRFVSADTRVTLDQFKEVFFYLGLLGGLIPAVVAAGYFVSYRGMRGCDKGHVFDQSLPECPVCAAERAVNVPPPIPMAYVAPQQQPDIDDEPPTEPPRPMRPRAASRPKSAAWLVDMTTKRQHQLLTGETRLGRKKSANDVVLEDPTVGREHVRIQEVNGHFTLLDLGAQSGTYVNGRRLRGSQLLEDGDEITLGETLLKFKCS